MTRPLIPAVLALLLAACGNQPMELPPDSAQLTGTLGGQPFVPMSTMAAYGGFASTATIGIFDTHVTCQLYSNPHARGIYLTVVDATEQNTIEVLGEYTVGSSTQRGATAAYVDADGVVSDVQSGAVDITQDVDSGLGGSFDLTFADGSLVQGMFDATTCDSLVQPTG